MRVKARVRVRVWVMVYLRDLLDRLGEHGLRVLGRLEPRAFQPHVLVCGARAAAVTYDLTRRDELTRDLLEPCGRERL